MKSNASSHRGERHVSQFALLLAGVCFLPLPAMLKNPQAVLDNENIRQGIHDVLGRPETPYNLFAATLVFLLTPGLILGARAFFAPSIGKVILTVFEAWAVTVLLMSALFGKMDIGVALFVLILLICLPIDILSALKERRNARVIARALAEMQEPSKGKMAA